MATIKTGQLVATGMSAGFCGGVCLRWATELPLAFALGVGAAALMTVSLGWFTVKSALN